MSNYQELENFKKQLENTMIRTEIQDIIDKVEIANPKFLGTLDYPNAWGILKDRDYQDEISRFKSKVIYAIDNIINKIPNIETIKSIQLLIDEGEALDAVPNKISPYVRKVNNSFGTEIGFPANTLSHLNAEEACYGFGQISFCKTTKEDLEGVIERLKIFLSKLSNSPQTKESKTKKQDINVNVNNTNYNTNNISVEVKVQIENVLNEIENDFADGNLTDKEIAECKEQLEILKQSINDKPKSKWEKCKGVFTWLGDKTIKFGKWFIPIMAEILINKATTPTA